MLAPAGGAGYEYHHNGQSNTLLTIVMRYWTPGSIGSSFTSYFDYAHNDPHPQIDVPVAVTLSREPSRAEFPHLLAERVCGDIRFWHVPEAGGHFMALEQPDRLCGDIFASAERMISTEPGCR